MAIRISSTTVIDNSRNLAAVVIPNTTTGSFANTFVCRDSTGVICIRSPVPSGTIICKAASVNWIVAPAAAEVLRTWYLTIDANTRAQAVTGCTGWFVPLASQLQNPGYTCRFFWDCFSSSSYWSSTQETSTNGCFLCFPLGALGSLPKSFNYLVRSFRCVAY